MTFEKGVADQEVQDAEEIARQLAFENSPLAADAADLRDQIVARRASKRTWDALADLRYRGTRSSTWVPFRPQEADLERIGDEVGEMGRIQRRVVERHPDVQVPDRVAHQYQIAASKVTLAVADSLPAELRGVGLFEPGAEHRGIGRVSTGLGCPHLETDPDFLGLMLAFATADGRRVDFLSINHPAAPTANHRDFMSVLHATGEAAGAEVPLVGDWGDYEAGNILATNSRFGLALIRRVGPVDGGRILAHITRQTLRTFHSSTAYQTYWTGVVEAGGQAGKFMFRPTRDDNPRPGFRPGERHLSEDWKRRQRAGDLDFTLYWLPFLDQQQTPTRDLMEPWNETQRQAVGRVRFPQTDLDSEEALLWALLATEMGANPGNWVHDRDDTIREPASRFTCARKIGYGLSQKGRGALAPEVYREIFTSGEIGPELAAELARRAASKAAAGHLSQAPRESD